jgi:hypothetical protein
LSLRSGRQGSVEWCCALCAESGFRSVLETAVRAPLAERRCTLIAKPRARGIIGSAARTMHARTRISNDWVSSIMLD